MGLEEVNFSEFQPSLVPICLIYLKYTRQRQQAVMMLQHCAILSQLNRHRDALDISKATAILLRDVTQLASEVMAGHKQNSETLRAWEKEKEELMEVHAQNRQEQLSQKKERRGRNGRKPSVVSLSAGRAGGSQNPTPMRGEVDHHHVSARSVSQHSYMGPSGNRSKLSFSMEKRSQGASSRCLSRMSKTSQKSVKQINASLERIHTFGMSSIHRGRHEIEKIDGEFEGESKEAKLLKTKSKSSLAKLKNAIE